jgi:hypothetical protein
MRRSLRAYIPRAARNEAFSRFIIVGWDKLAFGGTPAQRVSRPTIEVAHFTGTMNHFGKWSGGPIESGPTPNRPL